METDRNPQAEQMASEAMVRTLAAQAEAIWPQERGIISRHGLPTGARILDVGCGTGEITTRLAEMFSGAIILGIDLDAAHIERARERAAALGDGVRHEVGDAYELQAEDASFDLVLCRHMLQAVPEPERIIAELARVTRAGGWLHLVVEDYGMMHFHPTEHDIDAFWRKGPVTFARNTGTDLHGGRRIYTILADLGLAEIRVDYVVVDTARVPRAVFADIWRAWRDGYTDVIARHTELSREHVEACWKDMIRCIEDPRGYAVWQVPVLSARR